MFEGIEMPAGITWSVNVNRYGYGMASTMSKQTSAKSMLTCQTVKSRKELMPELLFVMQRIEASPMPARIPGVCD